MLEILEELGITIGECIGAAIVLAGVASAIILFSEYGYDYVQLLVGA